MSIDAFVAPIAVRVSAMILELKKTDNTVDTEDPQVLSWAKTATRLAEAFCGRPLVVGTVKDRMNDFKIRRELRVTPATSITAVRVVGSDTDLDAADSELQDNEFVLLGLTSIDFSGLDFGSAFDLKVTYVAGYTLASDNEQLLEILSMQCLIWYTQKDTFGQKTVNTEQGTVSVPSEPRLNPEVKRSLARAGFRYEGDSYPVTP